MTGLLYIHSEFKVLLTLIFRDMFNFNPVGYQTLYAKQQKIESIFTDRNDAETRVEISHCTGFGMLCICCTCLYG